MIDLLSFRDQLKFKKHIDRDLIWCQVRKDWYVLTPEEVVRQSAICYLVDLGFSPNHITVERQIFINGMRKRYDIAVSSKKGDIHLLVECKEPRTQIMQSTLNQAGIYNIGLKSRYIWITNGHQNYMYLIDHDAQTSIRVEKVPLISDH